MNQRPTRAPAPPPAEETEFTEVREIPHHVIAAVEAQRVNHAPPAVREPVQEIQPQEVPARPRVEFQATGFGKVVEAIANIMAELKPVEKLGWNKFHQYAHARIGDLNAALTPLMGKHGIVIFQNEVGRDLFDGGAVVSVRYEFTVVHKSGEMWPERPVISGVARCRTTKESFDDKTFNKCHTAARKYFLISLFQIPVEDADDVDNSHEGNGGGQPRQRPQGQRRQVPSPDGKINPHLVPIAEGDTPATWVKKFVGFIDKATDKAEIDSWYDLNAGQLDKLKAHDEKAYDGVIDAMDRREAALAKPDPISSGKQEVATTAASDFPGDTPAPKASEPVEQRVNPESLDIPYMLDVKVKGPEKDWLRGLDEAFKDCEDAASLRSEQESVMLPSKDSVSALAWAHAIKIMKTHLARIQG